MNGNLKESPSKYSLPYSVSNKQLDNTVLDLIGHYPQKRENGLIGFLVCFYVDYLQKSPNHSPLCIHSFLFCDHEVLPLEKESVFPHPLNLFCPS